MGLNKMDTVERLLQEGKI